MIELFLFVTSDRTTIELWLRRTLQRRESYWAVKTHPAILHYDQTLGDPLPGGDGCFSRSSGVTKGFTSFFLVQRLQSRRLNIQYTILNAQVWVLTTFLSNLHLEL